METNKYKSAEQRFSELVAFKEKFNRIPSYRSESKDENEKPLYSWIQAMKMAKKEQGTARYPEWLDEKASQHGIGKWFEILDKAREQFDELVKFYQKNNRKPKRYKSENKEESKLAHWIHQMRQEKKRKTKRYPDWLDSEADKIGIADWFFSEFSKEDKTSV